MLGSNVKRLALVAVIAAAVLSLSAQKSKAHWGCWWRWDCYTPCVTVYRPVVCSPVVYRWWCYRPTYSCCRATCYDPCAYRCSSTCGYRCYRRCCSRRCNPCGYGYYDSCYGAVAGCCGSTVVSEKPAEVDPSVEPPAEPSVLQPEGTEPPPLPEPPPATDQQTGTMILSMDVPEDARVYVNGVLTKTPGTHRQFVSRGLASGYQYTYRVRAVVDRNGKELSDTQVVRVEAGDTADLAFDFDRATPSLVPTTLTVHVPEDAEVTLEGHDTNATGSVRQFTTTGLAKGAEWNDYSLVVTLNRDGRVETRRKTINLIGGESRKLSFDFAPERVAAR